MSNRNGKVADIIYGYLDCRPSCDTAGKDEQGRCKDCFYIALEAAYELRDAGLLAPDTISALAALNSAWANFKLSQWDLKMLEMSGAPIPEWADERAPTGEVTIQHLITYWAHLDRPTPDDCPPDIHQPGWQLDKYGDKFAGVLAGRVWVTDRHGWGRSYDPDEIRTAAHKLLAAVEEAKRGRL